MADRARPDQQLPGRDREQRLPFWDALTTAISLAAQFLLNAKRIENWAFWIAADLIYVPLYMVKRLNLTALVYVLFLGLCAAGVSGWRKALRAGREASRPGGRSQGRVCVMAPPFGHGLVLGKFYPPHLGHLHLISEAAAGCDAVGLPGVTVGGVSCDAPVDYGDPAIWAAQMAATRAALDRDQRPPVDAVFTGEGYGGELAGRLGAEHVPVDPGRRRRRTST